MNDTLHSYYPTSIEGRGIHVFTTTDEGEAFVMLKAADLKTALFQVVTALQDVMAWETVITEAIEQTHPKQTIFRELCNAFYRADEVLRTIKGASHE